MANGFESGPGPNRQVRRGFERQRGEARSSRDRGCVERRRPSDGSVGLSFQRHQGLPIFTVSTLTALVLSHFLTLFVVSPCPLPQRASSSSGHTCRDRRTRV